MLRARLGWILLTTLVVVVGAAAYSWSRTPMYRAQAEVLVDPMVVSGATVEAPNMETEKALVSSNLVLETASSSLGVGARELSRGVSVSVPVDSRVLAIAYAHRDPREARRRAQALADAYVAFHSEQQAPRPPTQNNPANTSRTMGSLAGAVQGVVITPATVPRSPVTPNHLVDLAVALLVGLAVGVGSAMVRDRLDDRLRGTDDVEAHVGRRVLATIPAFRAANGEPTSQLVMVRDPDSSVAEAYRNLRTLLLREATRLDAKTLLVTTPSGEGTTNTAANLAVAMAQAGRRVVLVCADLRRPRTHQVFGVENQVGLTAVVNGRLDLSKALVATNVSDLVLLTAGWPSDPGAVLLAPTLRKALDELRGMADFVVIDAPPMSAGPDTGVLTEFAEMILLVVDAQRSTGAEVGTIAHQPEVREKLIGCVLDNVGRRRRLSEPIYEEANTRSAAATTASSDGNGRFVGRVPSPVRTEHQETPGPNNNVDVSSGK